MIFDPKKIRYVSRSIFIAKIVILNLVPKIFLLLLLFSVVEILYIESVICKQHSKYSTFEIFNFTDMNLRSGLQVLVHALENEIIEGNIDVFNFLFLKVPNRTGNLQQMWTQPVKALSPQHLYPTAPTSTKVCCRLGSRHNLPVPRDRALSGLTRPVSIDLFNVRSTRKSCGLDTYCFCWNFCKIL